MSNENYLTLFFNLLLLHVPMLVVAVAGLGFSISRKVDFPRVSKWASWGFSLLVAHSLVSTIPQFAMFLIRTEISGQGGLGNTFLWLNVLGMAAYPLFIAGFVILARSIFLDREISRHPVKIRAEAES